MVGASKGQPVKADLLLTQELPNKIQKTLDFFLEKPAVDK